MPVRPAQLVNGGGDELLEQAPRVVFTLELTDERRGAGQVLDDDRQVMPGESRRTQLTEPQAPLDQVELDGLLMLIEQS